MINVFQIIISFYSSCLLWKWMAPQFKTTPPSRRTSTKRLETQEVNASGSKQGVNAVENQFQNRGGVAISNVCAVWNGGRRKIPWFNIRNGDHYQTCPAINQLEVLYDLSIDCPSIHNIHTRIHLGRFLTGARELSPCPFQAGMRLKEIYEAPLNEPTLWRRCTEKTWSGIIRFQTSSSQRES